MAERIPSYVSGCLLVLCCLLVGCGYSSGSLVRGDVGSVYVPVFENRTFRRGYEVELTRAVIAELKRHSLLTFAPRETADSVLSGEITDVEESVIAKSENDDILEKTIEVTVEVRWRDNLTGTDIVPPWTVREPARQVLALGEEGRERVFRELAQRIVENMWENW